MSNLLFSFIFLAAFKPTDSLKNFQQRLTRELNLRITPPPEFFAQDTCYHYTALVKANIDKYSRVTSIVFSDSGPEWLKKDMEKQQRESGNKFKVLDTLALKARLSNCILLFPVFIESDRFPCGVESKKRGLPANYFQFNQKSVKGNIIFGDPIEIIWPSTYLQKE